MCIMPKEIKKKQLYYSVYDKTVLVYYSLHYLPWNMYGRQLILILLTLNKPALLKGEDLFL